MTFQSSILSKNQKLTDYNENSLGKQNFRTELLENSVLKKLNNEVDFTENRYQVDLKRKP